MLSLARFNTTSIGGHQSDPLEAIAAAALGGTSVFGGVGSIAGTVVGVWIPGVLRNGIIILGVQPYWQGIIIGLVLVATVWFDQYRRRVAAGTGGLRRMRLRSTQAVPPSTNNNHQARGGTMRRTPIRGAAFVGVVGLASLAMFGAGAGATTEPPGTEPAGTEAEATEAAGTEAAVPSLRARQPS